MVFAIASVQVRSKLEVHRPSLVGAKGVILLDEEHVGLPECVVQGAPYEAAHVERDELPVLKPICDFGEERNAAV